MADESLFTSQVPTVPDACDGGTGLTRGQVMYAIVAGNVKGIRWYSSTTAPPNTPTLELWTPTSATTGTKLATKAYTGSHVGGTWQTQLFDTPVHVSANTYFVPCVSQDTRYVFRASTFNAGTITNGNLVGIQDNTDPLAAGYLIGNGRLNFAGPNAYPDFSPGTGPGYLVDVLFAADFTTQDASATLSIADTLASTAVAVRPVTATLSVADALSASASASRAADTALSIATTLTATATVIRGVSASLAVTTALSADASGGTVIPDIDVKVGKPRRTWFVGQPRSAWTTGAPR